MAKKDPITPLRIPAPESQAAPAEAKEKQERLSVPLTETGVIDWNSVRPATKDKIKKAISDPQLSAQLGTTAGVTVDSSFNPELIGALYDALGTLAVSVTRGLGYPIDEAAVMMFTAEDKKTLIPATMPVVNKYSGVMGKYDAEIVLALTVGVLLSGKVTALKMTHARNHPSPVAVFPQPETKQ